MARKKTTKKELTDIINEEIVAIIPNVRKTINRQINSALMSIIGLENRYSGGVEIDHCNGRNSVLIDAFRRYATEEAEKIARSYKPSKEDITGFKEAFRKEFNSQMHYKIRDAAKDRAKLEAAAYIDKIKVDVERAITGGD